MRGRALVAWNLRRIRVNRGLSQKKLAFDAGIDRSYVAADGAMAAGLSAMAAAGFAKCGESGRAITLIC
jgi:predicted transcriptional regulator